MQYFLAVSAWRSVNPTDDHYHFRTRSQSYLTVCDARRKLHKRNHIAHKLYADPFCLFIILPFFPSLIYECGQMLPADSNSRQWSFIYGKRQCNNQINNTQRVISIYQSHCTDQQWFRDHAIHDVNATAIATQTKRTNVAPADSEKCIYKSCLHTRRTYIASLNYHKLQNKHKWKNMKQKKFFVRPTAICREFRDNIMCVCVLCVVYFIHINSNKNNAAAILSKSVGWNSRGWSVSCAFFMWQISDVTEHYVGSAEMLNK